jgi:hypothetical protein
MDESAIVIPNFFDPGSTPRSMPAVPGSVHGNGFLDCDAYEILIEFAACISLIPFYGIGI